METKEKTIPFGASKLENIDTAMYNYVDRDLNLHANTSLGWKKIPVIWGSAERSFNSKRDQSIRDETGALIYPLISIERTSVVKDPTKKGTVPANILPVDDAKGGTIPIARRIKQDKTSTFLNAHTKRKIGKINFPTKKVKTVYETVTIPLPVYVTINYEITIITNYQQEMNQLVTPFITKPGGINYILIKDENHRYEGFIQADFAQNNNAKNFTTEERKFETKVNIEVLGHLIGSDVNEDQPNVVIRENIVEVKVSRERVMLGDKLEEENDRLYGRSNLPDLPL